MDVVLESGSTVRVDLGAAFNASPAGIAAVDGDGTVHALAEGTANITAFVMGIASNPSVLTVAQAAEARGIWVTRWNYRTAQDIENVLTAVAEAGFNQVYWQVRGRADAFYPSTLEPWGSELTGTLGGNPGYDPLQTAITKAHAKGLELHAWVNTFPAWSGTTPPIETTPRHVVLAHPEWRQVDSSGTPPAGSYETLSPGNPLVRDHISSVLEEICAYDVDGLHLDYIRYSGRGYSHDTASEAALTDARTTRPNLTREDFQREAIADMVARARTTLSINHPTRPLSAAVWFVYENSFGWSSVSQGNVDYYQDTELWVSEGSIDVLVPMLYFPLTDPPGGRLDFLTLVEDHAARAGAGNRVIYAGLEMDYASFDEIAGQIAVARTHGAYGTVAFAYSTIVTKGWFDDFKTGPFATPAEVPVLPWLSSP